MDSAEKLTYAVGFLDAWQLFKKAQKDPQTQLKAAYVFERLFPQLAPSWDDKQIIELIQEAREENIMKKIEDIFQQKASHDEMLKQIEKHKIDWSKL